jgi:hypothetical protein
MRRQRPSTVRSSAFLRSVLMCPPASILLRCVSRVFKNLALYPKVVSLPIGLASLLDDVLLGGPCAMVIPSLFFTSAGAVASASSAFSRVNSSTAITTRSSSRPKPHLASFAVRAFIRFPMLLLASCDEYGRICNSYVLTCGFRLIRPPIPIRPRPRFRFQIAPHSDFRSPGGSVGHGSETGNILLSNIHRVYEGDNPPTFEDADTADYFGKRPEMPDTSVT